MCVFFVFLQHQKRKEISMLKEIPDFIVLNLGYAQTVHHWGNKDISSPFARIYYVKQGRAVLHLEHCDVEAVPGHMYLIPTYMPHSYECEPGFGFYYLFVYQRLRESENVFDLYDFPLEVSANEAARLLFENYCHLYPQLNLPTYDASAFDSHPAYRAYAEAFGKMEIFERMQLKGLVVILFSYFMKRARAREEATDERIRRILDYVRLNISRPISIEELSDYACLTKSYLIRSFRRTMGITPLQYVLRQKIQHAQSLLLGTNDSVASIALAVGFPDASYFTRLFHRQLGFTPIEYRKKLIG